MAWAIDTETYSQESVGLICEAEVQLQGRETCKQITFYRVLFGESLTTLRCSPVLCLWGSMLKGNEWVGMYIQIFEPRRFRDIEGDPMPA